MNYNELQQHHNRVFEYIEGNRIKDAFDVLDELVQNCHNKDLVNQLGNHKETYRNILKYSFELEEDPEKKKVYARLLKEILELADDIREDIIFHQQLLTYYRFKGKYLTVIASESKDLADSLSFKKEIELILDSEKKDLDDKTSFDQNYRNSLVNIFKLIWLTDKFGEVEIKLVRQINHSKIIPWYDKSILVSALTLSLFRHFDVNKVHLLFEFFNGEENQVWQRALIGIFLGLYRHDQRLNLYPEIVQRLKVAKGNKKLEKNIEAIVIQFLKARETEKVTKKIREEIFPEMMRIKSTLEEKLDLEDLLSMKNIEEKNPEWETVFKDTPDLYSKLEEFSMLQMEGSDVFLSAFAMLKRFDFFNETSNWFLPFHKDNENISEALKDEQKDFDANLFVEGLERSSFLCNSDKYSFCLNVRHMPSLQKSMMMELFNMELKAMNELSDSDEMIDTTIKDKTVYTQYLQDLYRFFKLHPLKNEFYDVFEMEFDFKESNLFTLLIEDEKILRNIGEFYFEKNYYDRAVKIFEQMCCHQDNAELFEKTAFSYQKMGMFEKALEYYHKAELFDKNKAWVYKKIAYCSRKLKDYEKSLKYYLEAEKLQPDNLYIQAYLGHTYLDMENYKTALKYYFKVEYLEPDNHKVHRPIAWCSFVLGKFDNARKYFEKVISKEGNKNDYMNLGHVEWCTGKKKDAIERYKKSLERSEMDFEWFGKVMKEDSKYLVMHKINEFDIPLMVDYLKMSAEF